MKKCSRCDEAKPLDEFNRRSKSKDGRHPWCRQCAARDYQENATRHKQQVAQRKVRLRRELMTNIREYLQAHPCVDCGESDRVVLEFDHVRGTKSGNISTMVDRLRPWQTILEEIEKCEVRCANCHRRKTAKQRGFYACLASGESYVQLTFLQ